MRNVIEVRDLHRTYVTHKGTFRRQKTEVEALKGISFSVQEGEIFGLLGPNGAGKTTTIKILTTLLLPTRGEVRILGHDARTEYKELRNQINFILGGERNLYWRLSAYDNLSYFADLYKVPRARQRKRINELLELVGLTDVAHHRVETFSKGMKQKLQIARGLINEPRVLFLDEPTIGLDVVSARQLREILRDLNQQGTTIIHTTHYMYEADELCDRIAFINKGKVVALGTPQEMKAGTQQFSVVECTFEGAWLEADMQIRSAPDVLNVEWTHTSHSSTMRIQTASPQHVVPMLYETLAHNQVTHLSIQHPTLEDAYVKLVGGLR